MAGSYNSATLIGNLGADPEIKSFSNGGRICNMRIATSSTWTDRASGERRERTDWHNVVIRSDGLIGIAERYLRKGKKVLVVGEIRTRKWKDQNQNDRFVTEIVLDGPQANMTMLDTSDSGNAPEPGERRPPVRGEEGHIPGYDPDSLDDDEIPF